MLLLACGLVVRMVDRPSWSCRLSIPQFFLHFSFFCPGKSQAFVWPTLLNSSSCGEYCSVPAIVNCISSKVVLLSYIPPPSALTTSWRCYSTVYYLSHSLPNLSQCVRHFWSIVFVVIQFSDGCGTLLGAFIRLDTVRSNSGHTPRLILDSAARASPERESFCDLLIQPGCVLETLWCIVRLTC